MDSQELLAERGLWGCQAPLALEVRLQHPRNAWDLTGANNQSNSVFPGDPSNYVPKEPPITEGVPKTELIFHQKEFRQPERYLSLVTCHVCPALK